MHITTLLFCFATLEAKKRGNQSPLPVPEDLDKIVKPEDETFQRPVDFLHVYREGYGDRDYKKPLHLLESDMIKPKNTEHAMQLLKTTKKSNIQWIPRDDALVFNSPRDELLYLIKMKERSKNKTVFDDKTYDFSKMLERNLAYPVIDARKNIDKEKNTSEAINKNKIEQRKNISDVFDENGFYIMPSENNQMNWTTCDEFSNKALFHPHDIVNTQWVPFYIWSKRGFSTAVVHIFSYPTKKHVNHYKTSFGPYVNNIEWSQPKLLLTERREILLIASYVRGLFYGIPDQEAPTPEQGNVSLPIMMIRLKIQSPYIAMMYCDESYATIMAERGTEPATAHDKIREASTLGFKGFGRPVYQDTETQKLLSQMAELRKVEAEERKIIKITKLGGDVDYSVRH